MPKSTFVNLLSIKTVKRLRVFAKKHSISCETDDDLFGAWLIAMSDGLEVDERELLEVLVNDSIDAYCDRHGGTPASRSTLNTDQA